MSTRPTLKEIEMILTNAHMTLNGLEIRKCTPLLAVVIVRSTGSAKTNYINDVNVQKIHRSKPSKKDIEIANEVTDNSSATDKQECNTTADHKILPPPKLEDTQMLL
jgi:hypothetical protein